MDFKDRRTQLVLAGAAIALIAGVLLAWGLARGGKGEAGGPSPASEAGLVIDSSGDDGRLDPAKPLRCFVAGQFVGELTLAECAKRNGVATGALDVGLDQTGEIAATTGSSSVLQPLPPPPATVSETLPAEPSQVDAPAPTPAAASGPVAACWRFNGVDWRRLPDQMTLNDCVQALYAGRCEKPGDADYGRWDSDTLRRVTGRIERSGDNRSFRQLAPQRAGDCAIGRID